MYKWSSVREVSTLLLALGGLWLCQHDKILPLNNHFKKRPENNPF